MDRGSDAGHDRKGVYRGGCSNGAPFCPDRLNTCALRHALPCSLPLHLRPHALPLVALLCVLVALRA